MKLQTPLLLVLGLGVFPPIASAQVSTAAVYPTVTGSAGAVIPGARVGLHQVDTGATITRQSNEGAVFDFLRIGRYALAIQAEGFKRLAGQNLELAARQVLGRACHRKESCCLPITAPLGDLSEWPSACAAGTRRASGSASKLSFYRGQNETGHESNRRGI